jgi:hypothetical protein
VQQAARRLPREQRRPGRARAAGSRRPNVELGRCSHACSRAPRRPHAECCSGPTRCSPAGALHSIPPWECSYAGRGSQAESDCLCCCALPDRHAQHSTAPYKAAAALTLAASRPPSLASREPASAPPTCSSTASPPRCLAGERSHTLDTSTTTALPTMSTVPSALAGHPIASESRSRTLHHLARR